MAKKMYLVNNQVENRDTIIIWKEFQKALQTTKFIEKCQDYTEIEETDNEKNVIQAVKIENFEHESIKAVWRINLETEIKGISTKNYFRTPEIALLVLTRIEGQEVDTLYVILVELKSSLQNRKLKDGKRENSTLQQCQEKFIAAMNRMYMLLSLNYEDLYNCTRAVKVKFKGIICYKGNKPTEDDDSHLFKILTGSSRNSIYTCETLLNPVDKIEILFFNDEQTIDISTIINTLST